MDYGHEYADKQLKKLERRLAKEYMQAYKEMHLKAKIHFAQFQASDKGMQTKVQNKVITQRQYKEWRQREMLLGEQYNRLVDSLSVDYVNVSKIAEGLINDNLADVYSLNYNYGIYEIENATGIYTSYNLYSFETVKEIAIDEQRTFLIADTNIPKALQWNRQHINSVLLQGVLQGEPIEKIANRLRQVTDMNLSASIRNARTMTTSAENAGRIKSYEHAERLGVHIKKKWMATIDARTRDSHRELDGETIEEDEEFSNGLRYPADPEGKPSEVYNCRCTLVAEIEGVEHNTHRTSKMDYEEWKSGRF